MKTALLVLLPLLPLQLFGQTKAESEILNLSKTKFRWTVERQTDSLANLFDDDLILLHGDGKLTHKIDALAGLKNGTTPYDSIAVKEATVRFFGTTAVVMGKGLFVVIKDKKKVPYTIIYTEVYVRKQNQWKLVARQTAIPNQ